MEKKTKNLFCFKKTASKKKTFFSKKKTKPSSLRREAAKQTEEKKYLGRNKTGEKIYKKTWIRRLID